MKFKAIDAYIVLNDIVADLVIGTRSYEHLMNLLSKMDRDTTYEIGITRLCSFNVILSLSKYIEFYDHYKNFIPNETIDSCKKLYKILKTKKIVDFRNKVIGHIWDNNKKSPITDEDHEKYVNHIYGDKFEEFLLWINNPENNIYPNTVVSILEHTKNKIKQDYSIMDVEVFKK